LGGDSSRIFLETFRDAQIYEIEEHEVTTREAGQRWNNTSLTYQNFWKLINDPS
jgi:hypothetical protein